MELSFVYFGLISWFLYFVFFAAMGAENSEKVDENSDKEAEVEESSEKIKVQIAPKVEEEQDLKVRLFVEHNWGGGDGDRLTL